MRVAVWKAVRLSECCSSSHQPGLSLTRRCPRGRELGLSHAREGLPAPRLLHVLAVPPLGTWHSHGGSLMEQDLGSEEKTGRPGGLVPREGRLEVVAWRAPPGPLTQHFVYKPRVCLRAFLLFACPVCVRDGSHCTGIYYAFQTF